MELDDHENKRDDEVVILILIVLRSRKRSLL